MAQTVIEKIVQAHAVGLKPGQELKAGDYVTRALDPTAAPSYGVPGDE